MEENEFAKIKNFLDEGGKVKSLPRKKEIRQLLLKYISENFEFDRIYSEKEVSAICDMAHSFNDYFLIRRELVENGFVSRERDGSKYWREKK